MNNPVGQKNRPWQARCTFLNGDTVTITDGTPVVLIVNGTGDGYTVCNPSSATAGKTAGLFVGIACAPNSWTVGSYNDVISGGYVYNATMVVATRSATSAVWASYTNWGVGDLCSIDTVNNALAWSATHPAGASPYINLLDSIASATTYGSATSNTLVTWTNSLNTNFTALSLSTAATVATISVRVFLHNLG